MTPEVEDRLTRVLELLTRRTRDGIVKWDQNDRESFSVSLSRSGYGIQTRDGDSNDPFIFHVFDSNGAVVTEVNSSDQSLPDSISFLLRDLWFTVHAKTAEVITSLDAALGDLEQLPPF